MGKCWDSYSSTMQHLGISSTINYELVYKFITLINYRYITYKP